MLLGRLRVRGRLALIVALPALAVIFTAAPLIADRTRVALDASATARTARAAMATATLVRELQAERLRMIGVLAGMTDPHDLALQGLRTADKASDLQTELGNDIPPALDEAVDDLASLRSIRTAVVDGRVAIDRARSILTTYSSAIDALIEGVGLTGLVDAGTDIGRDEVALDALIRNNELIAKGSAGVVIMMASKDLRYAAFVTDAVAAAAVTQARFDNVATEEQRTLYAEVLRAYDARGGSALITAMTSDPRLVLNFRPLTLVYPRAESLNGLGQLVERDIAADLLAEAERQRLIALGTAWGLGIAATLFIAAVQTLGASVARSISRPLNQLTGSANAVVRLTEDELERVTDDESAERGPLAVTPIHIDTRDEIGELATAFTRIQETAAALVERQIAGRRNVAAMFGHVGRRAQNLVGRQLALIDQLGQDVHDPERLDSIYRLDHLTTRLRRSASSLVVLSGVGDVSELTVPASLQDIVRSAIGEIEDFTRIELGDLAPVQIHPGLVGDLVLMLAELLENATSFSPPRTKVQVIAATSDKDCWIQVIDRGLGMTAERLAVENARLIQRERLDLVPTDVLGLFVVGRLSRRHGINVRLTSTDGGGTTATIEVPRRFVSIAEPESGRLEPAEFQDEQPTLRLLLQALKNDRTMAASAKSTNIINTSTVPKNTARERSTDENGAKVDLTALRTLTTVLASAPSWNAFAAPPTRRPAISDSEAAPETGDDGQTTTRRLRQRVPGAQLPDEIRRQSRLSPTAVGPVNQDPDQARELVEMFEAGVQKANETNGMNRFADGPAGEAPGLPRHVPGENRAPTQRVPDTQEAADAVDPRTNVDAIEAYEAGAQRARQEIHRQHLIEEGRQA